MTRLLVLLVGLTTAACTQSSAGPPAAAVETADGAFRVVEVVGGLDHPWGLAFLPDGRMLVTERPGRLRIATGAGEPATVAGTPDVYADGQGGLLDVALAPDFETSGHVYLTYSKPGPDGGAATALGRGRLAEGADGPRLVGFEDLWVQVPALGGSRHFGSRIAFWDGHLIVSTGDRGAEDPAQDLGNTVGVLARLTLDGEVPVDNPFVGRDGVRPEIWSYGHRNAQSLAVHPETGELWEAEFGPRGGDELNRIERGANYGWPEVSWGREYSGGAIPDPPTRPEFTDAVRQWSPVISPSGMAFYTADAFPSWTGSLFVSSLSRQGLVRLELDGGAVTEEEMIPLGARIRDVEVGPDGLLYVLTDERGGGVWRLEPEA
jgi:glucose/arabinose dehydrogenase